MPSDSLTLTKRVLPGLPCIYYCYSLVHADSFKRHPENSSCIRNETHSSTFHCTPSNTSFTEVVWLLNDTEISQDYHIRRDGPEGSELDLPCLINYTNTEIKCIVTYDGQNVTSKTAFYRIQGRFII